MLSYNAKMKQLKVNNYEICGILSVLSSSSAPKKLLEFSEVFNKERK